MACHHTENYGLPRRAINGCLGEGGVNLVSAQRLVMNKTKPLFVIGFHLVSEPVPNAHIRACINLRSSSFKGVPISAPASCSLEPEDQGAIHESVRLKKRSFAPT